MSMLRKRVVLEEREGNERRNRVWEQDGFRRQG
jgi:hypothetical protein